MFPGIIGGCILDGRWQSILEIELFPVGEVIVNIYSGDVTFASDDVCRSKAHKWSGQAVFNFEIRVNIGVSQLTSAVKSAKPRTVVSAPCCPNHHSHLEFAVHVLKGLLSLLSCYPLSHNQHMSPTYSYPVLCSYCSAWSNSKS